ncbi:excinuclease ABC subunit UvrC [Dyadobacter chenwenxiniae]|uniref:UvrABC system protein C n=1 Tax=Dyadobacter chenwenxiniae TaxID=2906456 RepID=A0A9X1PLA2_9BACT|nr:excinuclease ABC subunit UvrC [Dyadobacter chenwenxiniae]MCF0053408.1 excinuclease ABC subunit UvrC [Dyadobacter chenwenxiniae]MCF0060861.1 excinuclease ABC subunit UvrC [Dyadobacter chenwenxiniae]UON80688.1 excinuclease ABC subunit UvrC [Dyadobacter chenwenxiniae]
MSEFNYKEELTKIPLDPGVYRYFDETGEVIYVGKAKSLRSRVSSYFLKSNQHDRKTRRLVSQIRRIEYTIVHSEWDALLLENQLIKQLQPKFNILLKDDKTYPFICVTQERFPRVYVTRNLDRSKGTFYGPFASLRTMHTLLDMFKSLYTIRSCQLPLSKSNIEAGKFKVCLEYHIGNCKGPCEGLQDEAEYNAEIEQIHNILKGNLSLPQQYFKEKMLQAAEQMEFEKAHSWKTKIEHLSNFQSKATVINPKIGNIDVLTIVSDEEAAYLNFMKIKQGYMVATQTVEVKKKLDESDAEILALMIVEMRSKFGAEARELISNIKPDLEMRLELTVPQIGDKKKLLDMSMKNVMYFRRDKAERREVEASATSSKKDRILIRLKSDLQLKTLPRHIECFDNSNIQGTNPVAAMVCFKDGKPSKKDYRHFNIKTVIGPNDFASMNEVVGRRYLRLIAEEQPLPDLIVVDGGKGQLGAACDALKSLGIYGQVPIIGIAKRLEEIYFPEDSLPLYIDKKSESLKLIQQIRDEAHRFGITFHRDKRSKASLISELDGVDGVGKVTAAKLLKFFGSVRNIRDSSLEQLAGLVGLDRAKKVRAYFDAMADNAG